MKRWWRPPPEQEDATNPADEAIEVSARRRDRAIRRGRELHRLAVQIRRVRERNHLADAFEETFWREDGGD